jgi:translation initiation factor IF-1
MEEPQSDIETIDGRVIEALPSTLFRVETSDGKTIISYLGGRMRVNKIKVLVGDKVTVQIDPYGGKGRIIKRL